MIIEQIKIGDKTAVGLQWKMENAALLVIKADKGFVMCGYLNIETANKLGDVAAVVSGVSTFDDVLEAPLKAVSKNAQKLGISEGITGREALELMY
ncbi:uncharacterized protein YunC (DUF1805 family) [Methanohalophilus levihalophilus]|uniref:YunC family protein n=1 Tax=Methanohalophilus levihalophilus TaxID=1431282 RepID=UPI001AE3B5E4|nr:DUF1805 domain-containing protein [Methanohalophilus levihalophilus]MBP2029943.1 uncharacterized protein YunC (DUF1805 family) [Methanohalophilus levihalophilus]